MAFKKAKFQLEEEGDGWLLSYADMITLLFTFFVLLYAMSNPDPVKIQLLSNYFSQEKKMTFTELQQKIEEYIVDKNVQEQVAVKLTSKGVEIHFKDKVLFDVGKAALKDAAYPILSEIGKLLNYEEIADRKLSVEGHTDSIPIKSELYPSNWELSSARAASVVRTLVSQGLNYKRFESIGYADTRPVIPETGSNRGLAENRRVVVVISPTSYMADLKRTEIEIKIGPKKIKDRSFKSKALPIRKIGKEVKQPEHKPVPVKEIEKTEFPDKAKMRQYFAAGQQEFKNGNHSQAIMYWEKVLEIDPNHQLSKTNIERAKAKLKK